MNSVRIKYRGREDLNYNNNNEIRTVSHLVAQNSEILIHMYLYTMRLRKKHLLCSLASLKDNMGQ
jgi:hypothetical protein